MTSKRKLAFAAVAILLSLSVSAVVLLAVDVYLHNRFATAAGLNVWGYRGPALGRKQPEERRVFVLGGSTAFGYGVVWSEALPAVLERTLNEQTFESGNRVSVINLAYNNEGAFSFQYTLHDYEYLQPDVVILYTGYNDLGGFNTSVFRHTSPVFRLTGYMPILPVILSEKAMSLRYGGDLNAAYGHKRTVFTPDLVARTSATALETAAAIGKSLERQLGRFTDDPEVGSVAADAGGCGEPWTRYCDSVGRAVEDVLDRGQEVVVVTEPDISDTHVDQQRALHEMLGSRFAGNPSLHLVDAGLVDLKDPTLASDGMHLTARGNTIIADRLLPAVREALTHRRAKSAQ